MYDFIENEARRDRMVEKKMAKSNKVMSANEWRFNDWGSANPHAGSIDAIFSAYHDYRNSQQWN